MNDTNTTAAEEPARVSVGKLALGIVLVAVGGLAFVDWTDLWNPRELWRFWPAFLIVLGVSAEIDALRTRKGDGGYVLVAIGVWLLAGTHEFMGLDYVSAFPLGVAVAGMGLVLHALAGVDGKKEKES